MSQTDEQIDLPEVREPIFSSHSGLVTHRECPQKWEYAYGQRLSRVEHGPRVELDFGSWWHAMRAAFALQRGRTLGSLRWTPEEVRTTDDGPRFPAGSVTIQDVAQGAAKWWRTVPTETKDIYVERLREEVPKRLVALYSRWRDEWDEEIKAEQPLAVELRWKRTLPGEPPSVAYPDGVPDLALMGFIDEVYLDTSRNIVVVRDHKTGKTLSTQTTADDLLDSQTQIYAWGAAPVVESWGLGPIRATAYDRVRSVAAREPVVTQSGTLSKTITDYDLHTYLAWASGPDGDGVPYPGRAKDGSQAGKYTAEESVVMRLSDPAARSAWFQRTRTPVSRHMVAAHLRTAADTARDVEVTKARVAETGSAARLFTSNCKWCDFASLCRAQLVGGPEGEYDLTVHGLRKKG